MLEVLPSTVASHPVCFSQRARDRLWIQRNPDQDKELTYVPKINKRISTPIHSYGLGEETGVPEGNPCSTERTCKLHTHRATVGLEPRRCEVNVLTTKPPCAPVFRTILCER